MQSVTNWTVISHEPDAVRRLVGDRRRHNELCLRRELARFCSGLPSGIWTRTEKNFIKNNGKDEHVELRIDNKTANINGKNLYDAPPLINLST